MEGLEYEGEEYIDRNDDNAPFAEPGDDEDEEDELGELGELGDEDDAGNEDEDARVVFC